MQSFITRVTLTRCKMQPLEDKGEARRKVLVPCGLRRQSARAHSLHSQEHGPLHGVSISASGRHMFSTNMEVLR